MNKQGKDPHGFEDTAASGNRLKSLPESQRSRRRGGRRVAALALTAAVAVGVGIATKVNSGSAEKRGREAVSAAEYNPLIRQGVRNLVKSSRIESTQPQTQPNGQQDFTHRTDKHGLAIGASRHTSRSEIEALGITLYQQDGSRLDLSWVDSGAGPGAAPERFRATRVDKNNHSHTIAELGDGPVPEDQVVGAQNVIATIQGVIKKENAEG